jgi:acyl carrier protein
MPEREMNADSILQVVLSEVRAIFGNLDVRPDDNFFAIGGTSIDAVELAQRLQFGHGLETELEHVFSARDLRDIADNAHSVPESAGS